MKKIKIPVLPSPDNPIHKVSVEDNAIKAISPSFSVLGGKTHKKGGTMVQFGSTIVEAQQGEPLSTDENGNIIAWGKLKNPMTNNIFETDAKKLAKEEIKTINKLDKGAEKVNTSDYTKKIGAFSFGTGKVLTDAAIIEQQNIEDRKREYASTQQMMLDIAELSGKKPERIAKQMAKNGATLKNGVVKVRITGLPKNSQANNGGTFNPYQTPEEQYVSLINQDKANINLNQNHEYIQPLQQSPIPIAIPKSEFQDTTVQIPTQQTATSSPVVNTINKVGSFVTDAINAVGSVRRDIMVAAPQILNSMIPDVHNERERVEKRSANQYAYGTGSKMMYNDGGKIYQDPNRKVKYKEPDALIYPESITNLISNNQFSLPGTVQPTDQIKTTQPQGTSGFGEPIPLTDFNNYWGQDWSNNIKGFQEYYNQGIQTFNERYPNQALPTEIGFSDQGFRGVDGNYGYYTSSRGRPIVPLNLTNTKYQELTEKGIISKDNQGREYIDPRKLEGTGVKAHTDGIQLYAPRTTQKLDLLSLDENQLQPQRIEINQTPVTAEQIPITKVGAVNTTNEDQSQPTKLPSLADRNRLGIMSILPELSAMFDQPSYVPRQEFTPELLSPYQVTYQDRINQNMAVFNQQAQMMKNDPDALATLAAQARQANDNVLAEEFRTNQAISNQIYNQNVGTLNQSELQNMQLRDQQFIRQEQARENTKNNKRAALRSISEKVQQNKAENIAIRMIENMSKYRMDDNFNIVNYNPHPNFRYKNVKWDDLTEQQKKEAYPEAVKFTVNQSKEEETQIKRLGGSFIRRF